MDLIPESLKYLRMDVKQQVLDLSKRRDSVETRNTPSPYNTSKSTEDSPNARTSDSGDYPMDRTNGSLIPDYVSFDMRYNSLAHLHRHTGTPEFNRSLSPINGNNSPQPPMIPPFPSGLYASPQLNTLLLQNALLHKGLAQSGGVGIVNKEMGNFFETNANKQTSSQVQQTKEKSMRQYKLYPHESFLTGAIFDEESAAKFNNYRKRILDEKYGNHPTHVTTTNSKMRRPSSRSSIDSHPSIESTTPAMEQMETSGCSSANLTISKSQCTSGKGNNLLSNNNINNNNNNINSNSNKNSNDKDEAYFERRRKNNAAAKKSRDRRRLKEDEMAIRAAFFERENVELKVELGTLRKQLSALEDKLAFYEATARMGAPK